MLLRAVPKRLLNTDRHGAPNSSLGSRCQCLTILMVQKFSLMSSVNWTSPTALCHSHAFFPQLPAAQTSTFPPQQVAESHEVASWPPILQTGQHKCSQSLLIGPAFQPFYQLCCLPLHTFNYLHILFSTGVPLSTRYSRWGHINAKYGGRLLFWLAAYAVYNAPQNTVCNCNWTHYSSCGLTERKDHICWPVSDTLPSAANKTTSLLRRKGTWLTHVQLGGHQDAQLLFCRAAFQQGGPRHALVPAVVPLQVQDSELALAELHEVLVSPPF